MTNRTRIQTRRLWCGVPALLSLLILSGCSEQTGWDGPQRLSTSSVDAWQYHDHAGWKLGTPHYTIYTTIEAEDETINRGLLLKFLGAVDG